MNRGFTLIETIAALALFLILATAGGNFLLYAGGASTRLSARNELMENSVLTLEFITEQLRRSAGYTLVTEKGGNSLKELRCYKKIPSGSTDDQVILFNKNAAEDSTRFGAVGFGGMSDAGKAYSNKLTDGIADIQVSIDGDLMTVKVISQEISGEAAELTGKIDLRYKSIVR